MQNHQKSVLDKRARGKLQASTERLARRPPKRMRSKNARDMVKSHHPDIRRKWTELSEQVKAKTITESEKFTMYDKAITELLSDEGLNAEYTAMAVQANSEDLRLRDINPKSSSSEGELEIIQYVYVRHLHKLDPNSTYMNMFFIIALRILPKKALTLLWPNPHRCFSAATLPTMIHPYSTITRVWYTKLYRRPTSPPSITIGSCHSLSPSMSMHTGRPQAQKIP